MRPGIICGVIGAVSLDVVVDNPAKGVRVGVQMLRPWHPDEYNAEPLTNS